MRLSGFIDNPDNGNTGKYAIFAHCFTCSKDLKAISNINTSLTNQGISCLRFDFTGIGDSEGDFCDTTYSSNLEDMNSAINFLNSNYVSPALFIGHSIGGCIAIQTSCGKQFVKAVVTIGTPSEPGKLSLKLKSAKEQTEKKGIGIAEIGGKIFKFKKNFFEDLNKHELRSYIENLKKPLLILHSPIDDYSSIENAGEIFQAAKHPKSFISLDKMDHLMLKKSDAIYAGNVIAAWVMRYI